MAIHVDDKAHIELVKQRSSRENQWSDEDLLEALRRADREGISGALKYQAWASEEKDRPCFRTFILRFGSWSEARRRAGLSVFRSHEPWRTKDDQLLEAVVRVAKDLGHLPTQSDYRKARAAANGTAPEWPSVSLVRGALGGWARTLELVQKELRKR